MKRRLSVSPRRTLRALRALKVRLAQRQLVPDSITMLPAPECSAMTPYSGQSLNRRPQYLPLPPNDKTAGQQPGGFVSIGKDAACNAVEALTANYNYASSHDRVLPNFLARRRNAPIATLQTMQKIKTPWKEPASSYTFIITGMPKAPTM